MEKISSVKEMIGEDLTPDIPNNALNSQLLDENQQTKLEIYHDRVISMKEVHGQDYAPPNKGMNKEEGDQDNTLISQSTKLREFEEQNIDTENRKLSMESFDRVSSIYLCIYIYKYAYIYIYIHIYIYIYYLHPHPPYPPNLKFSSLILIGGSHTIS
jgi:hypothetical protein